MKKFLLYLIIFVSLFVGTATCVVVNGYSEYQKKLAETPAIEVAAENTVLTSLASNILNSESYSGQISFTDNLNKTDLSGTFSYINKDGISAQIKLNGHVNAFKINADIILLNNQIYLEFNGSKFKLSTNDIMLAVNAVISSINTGAGSDLSEIDTSALTSLLSDIVTTEYGSHYIITATIPNLCSIYIKTNTEYIPNQILVNNINLGGAIYTLNITASQNKVDINPVETNNYFNISPALNYISPVINTFTQGNLSLGGTLDINGTKINIRAYYNSKTKLISGNIKYGELKLDYQFDGKYIYINLYSNIYKFTIDEVIDLINDLNLTQNSTELNISNLLENININPTVKNDKLTACVVSYKTITFDFEIGKTLYIPTPFNTEDCQSATDLKNLITSYKNIISTNYSIDLALTYNDISINGRAYIGIDNNFKGINSIAFEGKINNFDTMIAYTPTTSYLKLGENKIKLENSALKEVLNTLFEMLGKNGTAISNTLDLDISLLNNITLDGRKITFSKDNINIQLNSHQNSYRLTANIDGVHFSLNLLPNSTTYSYIVKNINANDFKSFDEIPNLLNAIKNTLNLKTMHYSGNIDIKILGITYKNIGVDININQNINCYEIVLSNLPTDSIVTYLKTSCYKDQTSKITIQNNNVSIYTTVTHRLTNKTTCITNKTISIDDFSLDNLYDIMSMKKSIINKLKNSSNASSFSSNLTTDVINVYKNSTTANLTNLAPSLFNDLSVEFCYDKTITQAKLSLNIKDVFNVNITLTKQ